MISKQTKNEFKWLGIFVLILYMVSFAFLVVHNFQVWTLSPFVESIIGVFMGAGAIAIITGIILVFQSSIQSEQEKKKAVFDEKLSLYMKIIDDMNKYFEDEIIDEKENRDLFFTLLKVEILSKPATFKEFANLIQNLADENGNISEDTTKNLVQFIRLAREDLDVQEKITASSEKKLFDDAIKVTQSEGEKSASGTRYSLEKGKHSETELFELLSNYFSDKECKTEKQKQKKYKIGTFFNVLLSEDRSYQRSEIKEILINKKTWINHFEEDWAPSNYISEKSGQKKTYEWYVGNYMSNISKDFTRTNNDYLRQILSFESLGNTTTNTSGVGAFKDSYYIEKKYRPLIQKILNK